MTLILYDMLYGILDLIETVGCVVLVDKVEFGDDVFCLLYEMMD